MRHFDEDEAARLNAAPWQLALLKANPAYLGWGPHEDYMWKDSSGWDSRIVVPTWAEFGPWKLDELNECVNFYFEVNRASKDCDACGGNGYHPDAQVIVNTFYQHMCADVGMPSSAAWHDKITEDEAQALVDSGRAPAGSTAASINAAQHGRGLGHDAINRHILTEQRIKRELGLPDYKCPTCDGHGYVHTEPAAHVSLVLWWLHPRKGCSRGIEVTTIQQADLPAITKFLREAADRNATRFAGISQIAV